MNRRWFLWPVLVFLACSVGGGLGGALAASDEATRRVSVRDVLTLRDSVGREMTVYGRVTASSVSERSGHHFLNFDNREFSVICFASDLSNFTSGKPAELYRGRDIEITGLLERYRDKLQMRLRDPEQVKIVESAAGKSASSKSAPSPDAAKVELKKVGAAAWLSPAGLRYQGRDPDGLTRVEHVLRHARDVPDREGSHGVFDGGPAAVFAVIDEAWQNVEKKRIRPTVENDRSLYTVPMGRRVGYLGGRAGASRGHPPLSRIFLVIETGTTNVITAFPR